MASGANLLMNMFGRPRGIIGRLGGVIMARMNADRGVWVAGLLEVTPNDAVLEIEFGPGVIIQCPSTLVSTGHVSGSDPSPEMLEQARARNAIAIKEGRVDLRRGLVESLPFADDIFDKALAINSMQVWADTATGLRAIRRVMRPGGRIALGFTRYSGQLNQGLVQALIAAGFADAQVKEKTRTSVHSQ
jgi:ubiquinone/menaquinone biosynthesis C-methylase UbiE